MNSGRDVNFKRLYVEEGKVLNYTIHLEERIIGVLKSLKNHNEFSQKDYDNLYPPGSKRNVLYGFGKIHKALEEGSSIFCPI